jgi:hypothetical protein
MTVLSNCDTISEGGRLSLPRIRYGDEGDTLLHPPLAPPIEGGELKGMPFIGRLRPSSEERGIMAFFGKNTFSRRREDGIRLRV